MKDNYPTYDSNLPMTCIALTSGFGRILFGILSDRPGINSIVLQQVSELIFQTKLVLLLNNYTYVYCWKMLFTKVEMKYCRNFWKTFEILNILSSQKLLKWFIPKWPRIQWLAKTRSKSLRTIFDQLSTRRGVIDENWLNLIDFSSL